MKLEIKNISSNDRIATAFRFLANLTSKLAAGTLPLVYTVETGKTLLMAYAIDGVDYIDAMSLNDNYEVGNTLTCLANMVGRIDDEIMIVDADQWVTFSDSGYRWQPEMETDHFATVCADSSMTQVLYRDLRDPEVDWEDDDDAWEYKSLQASQVVGLIPTTYLK